MPREQLTQKEAVQIEFGLICKALKIVLAKRKDYSGKVDPYANLRVAEAHNTLAPVGVNIRCNDKLVRVSNVLQGDNGLEGLVGESVINDLGDIVNYSSITAGLIAEDYDEVYDQLVELSTELRSTIYEVAKAVGIESEWD